MIFSSAWVWERAEKSVCACFCPYREQTHVRGHRGPLLLSTHIERRPRAPRGASADRFTKEKRANSATPRRSHTIRPLDAYLGWVDPRVLAHFCTVSEAKEAARSAMHRSVSQNKYPWAGPLAAQWKPAATVLLLRSGPVPQHQNPHTNGETHPAHMLCKQLPLAPGVLAPAWREDQAGLRSGPLAVWGKNWGSEELAEWTGSVGVSSLDHGRLTL